MNRIDQLFQKKKQNVLSVYFTAGYPALNDTISIIQSLSEAGADMLEIGMPFSDPLADGPTIQESSTVALQNGMSVAVLLEQLKDIRQITDMPLVLMGYLNPVLQYGVEAFCQKASEVGIDGLIIPDMPLDEYQREYQDVFEKHGLKMTFLITPQTAPERIRLIDALSTGFIYLVTASGTTGKTGELSPEQQEFFHRIQSMKLKTPIIAGFGISDKKSFDTVCRYFNGGIVGSQFIRVLKQNDSNLQDGIKNFIHSLREAKPVVVPMTES